VKEELLSLVRLEGIGRIRARSLYDVGFTDVYKVAKAAPAELARVTKIGPTVAEKLKDQLKKKNIGQ
jgi:helicase